MVHVAAENIQNHGQLQTLNQVRWAQLGHQKNCWIENPLVTVKINYGAANAKRDVFKNENKMLHLLEFLIKVSVD